jgi:hypothetical protein
MAGKFIKVACQNKEIDLPQRDFYQLTSVIY